MANISPTQLKNQVPVTDAATAVAGGGDEFVWNGQPCLLIFMNGDASSKTVTIATQATTGTDPSAGPITIANRQMTIAAGNIGVCEIAKADNLLNASGRIAVTYSAGTNVKVAFLSL